MRSILRPLKQVLILLVVGLLATSCGGFAPSLDFNPWQLISLPTESTMVDIGFTGDPDHGWLVGDNTTLLETLDGGDSWQEQKLDLGDQKYTFTSVSFSGNEGWVVGQPTIMLHTSDGGTSWEEIFLSERLPGKTNIVTALGPGAAEMTTDVGAIYQTSNGGKNWKAMVEGAVGVVRNISRSKDGRYVAVSARGSFYSTWEPGEQKWSYHNRETSKRLQNMGFGQDGKLWLIARGGKVQFGESLEDAEAWGEPVSPVSTSWGLLDMSYRTPEEVWVTGGSGNLLCSFDGGQTWEKDRETEDVPGNFYRITFLDSDKGFVLGQRGVLLKYEGDTQAA